MKCLCRFAFDGNFTLTLVGSFLAAAGLALGGSPSVKTPESAPGQKTRAAMIGLPLSFEANRGQTDPSVKFLSRGDGYALFLTADSAVFKLRASGNKSAAVVRMKLLGANAGAKISGGEKLPGTANYFIGNDPSKWATNAGTFGRVNYQQVYPGIDLVYYGTQRQLEYDFIVTPGADPKQIGLEFAGAKPTLGVDGSLLLTLDGAPLTFRKPVIYQSIAGRKKMIAGRYKLSGSRVQFALGRYDHNRALVIDPVLSYLTYLGGSGTDEIGFTTYSASGNPTQGIAVDQSGNVYVTGYTQSTDFPVQNALQAVSTTSAPTGFVTKLNPAGSQLIYSTYIGGSILHDNTSTRSYAIAVDSSGSAYITGYTTANQFPTTAGVYEPACGTIANDFATNCPGQVAFVTKLSPSGNSLVYSTFLGHSNEAGVAIAVDSHGQAYVAGNSGDQCDTTSTIDCFPTTANAVLPGSAFNHTTSPANFNQGSAFISVLDAAGANLLYSSLFGGNGAATGNEHATFGSGVAVDSSGYFYLVGTTSSNQLPVTAGAFQTTFHGNPNAGFGTSTRGFVAKFNPVSAGASLFYTTYLGGFDTTIVSYQDVVAGIAADAAGNAYVSGNAAYDFPATPGANNTIPCPSAGACMNRGFLAKLNPAGSALVWATFVGTGSLGPALSAASTISPPRLDAAGNVYVSGVTGSNLEYPLVNPLQPANNFGGVYVTKYDPTGTTMEFSTVIYSPASNGGLFNSGVDVDPQGNIFVAGYANVGGLPVTAGAFQPANAGAPDGFVAKINVLLSPTIGLVVAPGAASAGSPVTFTATVTGVASDPTPTGSVNFMIGSTTLGSGTLNASGVATLVSSAINGGNYSVTAVYAGDSIYSTATSAASPLTITGSLPCTYSFSSGGQAFPATGGTGNIAITVGPGCTWTAGALPAFATLTSAGSGSGNGTVTYTVAVNSGGDRTGSFTINGQTFTIEQEAASIAGLNVIGSMAHLAAEENWTTAFTLVNKGAVASSTRLSFSGDALDPTGNGPLALPLAFPQQSGASGPLLAASFDRTLAANASLIVDSAGAQTPPVLVGSAQLAATGAVDGFAIFHQIVTTQEAVVPLETRNASSYLLAFDNTNGLVLGVAVENLSAQNAVIPVVIRDENGVVISTPGTTVSLGGNGHTSFVLSTQFTVTANLRGTIEFDTPSGGRISVLGLRFSPPNSALTTIPALANVGTGGGSIAHLASGGDGWQTTFVLVNTGSSSTSATLSFFNDQASANPGGPLTLPLAFPQSGGGASMTVPSYTTQLAAGATLIIVSSGAQSLLTGSAQLTTLGHVSGFVIFRHNDQEAVVPLESRNASGYIIAFDNTNGTATGIAVNAVSAGPVNVPVTVRDDTGATVATDTITLAPNGHYAFTLGTDRYPAALTIRGTIEFDTPAGAQIGALGIRIPNVAAHTYTTLPALAK